MNISTTSTTHSTEHGTLTKQKLRELVGMPRRSTPVASAPLSVLATYEGRRGSSVWQRRRLLSDVLVSVLADLDAAAKDGLGSSALRDLGKAIETVSRELAMPRVAEVLSPIAQIPSRVVGAIGQLEEIRGNGVAEVRRHRVVGDARQDRREAAAAARTSKIFGSQATSLLPIDSAVATLALLADRYPREFASLREATRRYWRRRGAIALEPEIAEQVKSLLPLRVFKSVEMFQQRQSKASVSQHDSKGQGESADFTL